MIQYLQVKAKRLANTELPIKRMVLELEGAQESTREQVKSPNY